jgi:oxalate decarboxylase/phosphoglucose isomerase-like protein (cupin superfamily)
MIGVAPQGWFHYIQNTSATEQARMLIIFSSEAPDNVDITWGFGITPPALLQQVFGSTFPNVDTSQIWISPAPGR